MARLLGKQDLIKEFKAKADLYVQALVFETQKRLKRRTPVDTGRARNNWNINRDKPLRRVSDGPEGIDTDFKIASLRAGDVVFLTNGVPYIEALEHGHSKQAPSGMIKITVAELKNISRLAVKKVAGNLSEDE